MYEIKLLQDKGLINSGIFQLFIRLEGKIAKNKIKLQTTFMQWTIFISQLSIWF